MSVNVPMHELEAFLEHSKLPLHLRIMMAEMPRRRWAEQGILCPADVLGSEETLDNMT